MLVVCKIIVKATTPFRLSYKTCKKFYFSHKMRFCKVKLIRNKKNYTYNWQNWNQAIILINFLDKYNYPKESSFLYIKLAKKFSKNLAESWLQKWAKTHFSDTFIWSVVGLDRLNVFLPYFIIKNKFCSIKSINIKIWAIYAEVCMKF